jgi:hypothetical protein
MLARYPLVLTTAAAMLLVSAVVNAAAVTQAQPNRSVKIVVVKDTRQYMTYTQSVTQDGYCSLAKDPDQPQKGDCEEVRSKSTVGGEYLVRVGDRCSDTSYSSNQGKHLQVEGRDMAPTVNVKVNTYKCDVAGNRS